MTLTESLHFRKSENVKMSGRGRSLALYDGRALHEARQRAENVSDFSGVFSETNRKSFPASWINRPHLTGESLDFFERYAVKSNLWGRYTAIDTQQAGPARGLPFSCRLSQTSSYPLGAI